LLNLNIGDPSTFVHTILNALEPVDVVNFLAKNVIPALFTCAICCAEGLRVSPAVTEVPAAAKRALTRSVWFLFSISALVSILTYL
jgi:ABC-type transporter Mla maintaining outer membrane lipid asymmetry permease subunit MlaE